MSGVPSQLRKQKAEILAKNNVPAEITPETVTTDTPVVETPEVTLPTQANIEPVITQTDAPIIEQPKNVVTISPEELQRLKTADGIAKAAGVEATKLQQENLRLAQQVEALNDTVDKILLSKEEQKAAVVEPETPAQPVAMNTEELTEDDKFVIGEFEPIVRKIVRLEVQSIIPLILRAVQEEIAPFKGKVETVVKSAEEQKPIALRQQLQSNIEKSGYGQYNCEQIHGSAEFLNWVQGKEDVTGTPYITLYNDAVTKTYNATVAARIQKEFLDFFTKQLPQNTVVAPSANAPESEPSGIPEDMIAPDRSSVSSAPSGNKSISPVTLEEVQEIANRYNITTNIGKAGGPTKEEYEDVKKRYFLTIQAQKNATGRK